MRRRRTLALVAAPTLLTLLVSAGCAAPSLDGSGGGRDDAPADAGDDGAGDDTGGDDGGHAGDDAADDGVADDGGAGGAVAAPDPDGGRGAIGAPVRIPREVADQGRPLEEVWAELDEGLREACGGELCVELVLEESDSSFTTCQFVETRPRQQTDVERGSTVVVVAGSEPCEDPTDEATDQPSEEAGEQTDGGTGGEATGDGAEEGTDDGGDG